MKSPDETLIDEAMMLDVEVSPAFLQYLEACGADEGLDPLSDEAVKYTAMYVKHVGSHPMDVLKSLVANPLVKPSERIQAAKTLMEYSMRKIPTNLEVSGPKGSALVIELTSADALKSLVRG